MSGLCGNFNGDDDDELRISTDGPFVHSVAEFVSGWHLYPHCKAPQIKSLLCTETGARALAEQKCQVLRSTLFEDCHNEVDVESYFKRYVSIECTQCLGFPDIRGADITGYSQVCCRHLQLL